VVMLHRDVSRVSIAQGRAGASDQDVDLRSTRRPRTSARQDEGILRSADPSATLPDAGAKDSVAVRRLPVVSVIHTTHLARPLVSQLLTEQEEQQHGRQSASPSLLLLRRARQGAEGSKDERFTVA